MAVLSPPIAKNAMHIASLARYPGNDYRLVVAVDFEKAIVWIKWIGTHKDYNLIDVKEVDHGD